MMMVMVLVILGRWRTDLGDEDGAVTEDGTDDALTKVLGTGELDDLGHWFLRRPLLCSFFVLLLCGV